MTSPTPVLSNKALGGSRMTGAGNAVGTQDYTTLNDVQTLIAGLSSTFVTKGAVRAAATSNVSVTSAPATIDGVTPNPGDIFLLTGNATGSENGPRVWTAAGAPMARAGNWNTTAKAVLGSFWVVEEGSNADHLALLTNDGSLTLDTTALAFTFSPVAAVSASPPVTKYTGPFLATAAGATATITHNLGTSDVLVLVKDASSGQYVDIATAAPTSTPNAVTLSPDVTVAAGSYTVIVKAL